MSLYFVDDNEAGIRLDVFVSNLPQGITRNRAQKLIEESRITVNDTASRSSRRLKAGDKVSVEIPPPKSPSAMPEKITLEIVFEDDDIMVINKPKGMVVHPAAGNHSGTLVNALMYHSTKLSGIGGVLRPGIVHRLDKDTSGLLVVAKSDAAHNYLSKELAQRKFTKIYLALVHGIPRAQEGIVEEAIGRHPVHRKKMAVISRPGTSSAKAREAITHYRIVERFKNYALVELRLQTGRTHQIRVHMSHMGFPIVGDLTYGKKQNEFDVKGQMLFAYKLAFSHPATKKYVEFEAPVPQEMKEIVDKLRQESR